MNRILSHSKYAACTSDGSLLCHGNPNDGLSYHIACIDFSMNDVVLEDLRDDLMVHVKRWVKECKDKNMKLPSVRMFKVKRINFYWE